jgi:putative endonuclease
VVERARLVHGTPTEKVCIPQKGIEGSNLNMIYYSYILKSLKDNKFYYGSTVDIDNRLMKHNTGQVASTKHRRPFIIHFVEEHLNRSLAFRREKFYKSIDGYNYLKSKEII